MLARYILFVVLAHVGPGLAILRLLRLHIDAALVLPLGFAACAGAYWVGAASGVWWWGPALLLALDLALLLPRGPWRMAPGPSLRGALGPLAGLVLLLALTQYRFNRIGPGGEFLLDPFVAADTAFHVGLTRELAIAYPPQTPGLAGWPLGYHLGTDLLRAAALRWAAVDPFDAVARLDVTVFALALLVALRAAAWAAGARGAALTAASWTLLAGDFSFLFAANAQAHWWADLLRGNLLVSIALANPIVPALALALGALVALERQHAGQGRSWAVVAAALAGAVPFFKVFLGAHLVLALAVAAGLASSWRRPAALSALPCALATLALALGPGGRTVDARFDPLDLVRVTRTTLGLEPMEGAALLGWSAIWLLASLGLRVVGVPAALGALRAGRSPATVALAVMALAGWPLGLMLRVSAQEVLGGQRFVNDAAFLLEQSSAPLWIFTAMALVAWARRGSRAVVVALAVTAAAVSLPATGQFVLKKWRLPPDPIPAGMVRAMEAVKAHSRLGEVVLQRPGARYPPLPVILAGRRVVYERFTPYMTQFAPATELTRRHERVFRFFRTHDRAEAEAIAREWGAALVCLYGADRVRFDAQGLLVPVFEHPQARVYRVELGSPREH